MQICTARLSIFSSIAEPFLAIFGGMLPYTRCFSFIPKCTSCRVINIVVYIVPISQVRFPTAPPYFFAYPLLFQKKKMCFSFLQVRKLQVLYIASCLLFMGCENNSPFIAKFCIFASMQINEALWARHVCSSSLFSKSN